MLADCCLVTCEPFAPGLPQPACTDQLHAPDVTCGEPAESDSKFLSESNEAPVIEESTSRLTPVNEITEDTDPTRSEIKCSGTLSNALNIIDVAVLTEPSEFSVEDVGETKPELSDCRDLQFNSSEPETPQSNSPACAANGQGSSSTSLTNGNFGHEIENQVLGVGDHHSTAPQICDVESGSKSSQKSVAKLDLRSGDNSPRSATSRLYSSERRPSAPAVMRDGHPSLAARQQSKNKLQANTVSHAKPSATSVKQTAQNIPTARSSVDLGRSHGTRLVTTPALNDSSKLRTARGKPDLDKKLQSSSPNGISQSSASRQSSRLVGSRTQSGSQLNVGKVNASPGTSSPVSLSGRHSRASVLSSQQGSSVDLSGLDFSRNGSLAVSQPQSSAASSVKSSPTEPSGSRRRGSNTNPLSSQKLTAAVGAISSRTTGPTTEPRNSGKVSLTTKRSSVIEMQTKPTLNDGNRRSSVTSTPTSQSRQQSGPGSLNSSLRVSRLKPNCASIATPSQRPDVVSNLVIDEKSANKIARLEVLCETKTKELSSLKNELNERVRWFEAMAIVVNFFVAQLECRACKRLTSRLQDAADQLNVTGTHLDELTKQRDALIDEIQNIKQFEEKQRENLQIVHEDALRKREMEVKSACNEELQKVLANHSQRISELESSFKEQLESLRENCDHELAEKECEVNEQLMELKLEHDSSLSDLQRQHECQLEEITQRFELIKVALSEKAEFLHTEGEELRKREKTYMETCQREFEMRIQSFNQLPQEIDSLKAVIELKNSELHDLRHHNMELQREMEELPTARETIKRLKQQVENLEAIISIRTDYEKQLAEKHQQLLRRYEQESKANKRLSMDKEELMYRLAQGDNMLETPRRSLSHSPTVAVDQVPDSARGRLPSNSRAIPERPLSAAVTPRMLSSAVASVKLRRSGTYDLLNRPEADGEVFD